jgi:hypothetical protein
VNPLIRRPSGRHLLQIPGPTNVPDRVLRAKAAIDYLARQGNASHHARNIAMTLIRPAGWLRLLPRSFATAVPS